MSRHLNPRRAGLRGRPCSCAKSASAWYELRVSGVAETSRKPRARAIVAYSANASGVTNSGDRGVLHRRLQVLADGEEIDIGHAQIVHHLQDFGAGFAEPDHQAGFGEDRRIEPLHRVEQTQRLVVARARADRRIQPRHGFEIVVEHVRPGFGHRSRHRPACAGNPASAPRWWCPARRRGWRG